MTWMRRRVKHSRNVDETSCETFTKLG